MIGLFLDNVVEVVVCCCSVCVFFWLIFNGPTIHFLHKPTVDEWIADWGPKQTRRKPKSKSRRPKTEVDELFEEFKRQVEEFQKQKRKESDDSGDKSKPTIEYFVGRRRRVKIKKKRVHYSPAVHRRRYERFVAKRTTLYCASAFLVIAVAIYAA